MTRTVRAVGLTLALLVAPLSACGPESPPAPEVAATMVPVADPEDGSIVGHVPLEDMDRVAREGGRAEVVSDGEVVGYLTPDGFVPVEH